MRIAVFHNLPFGGAKRVLYEEVKALSKENEIVLFRLSGHKKDIFDSDKYANKTFIFNFKSESNYPFIFRRLYSDYAKIFYLRRLHRRIAQQIDSSKFDVVLVHPDLNTQSPFILRYLKTKNIYYCHELLRIAYEKELRLKDEIFFAKKIYEVLIRKIYKYIDVKNAKNASLILVNSNYIKTKVKKTYKRNSTVCYPGVDSSFFIPFKNVIKKNILLSSGEGVEDLKLNNLKNLIRKIFKRNYFLKTIALNNKKIPISDSQMRNEYNNALITICLTLNEPFGMIPLESMSSGTPVIALNSGGYKETIINNKTGYLISNNNQSLEKILRSLNKAKLKKMGEHGRNDVISRFLWKNHISILKRALASV
ncbi:MAG TPA: glycosyltransferase [Candidatus Sulfotelmatobacter sp.]|nr:glycosyltransferase [Candidatus Sulfotelmatobacter sp.]